MLQCCAPGTSPFETEESLPGPMTCDHSGRLAATRGATGFDFTKSSQHVSTWKSSEGEIKQDSEELCQE